MAWFRSIPTRYVLLLLGLGLVPWLPMIVRDEVPALKDALHFFPGRRIYLEQSAAIGEPPYWDPGRAFGQPGLGSPDNSAVYPITRLSVWLVGGRRSIVLEGLLHTWLALFLSFGFLRRLRVSDDAALLGALVYGLSGMVLGLHWNPHHFAGAAWLPGVAWGIAASSGPLLALSIGMMALGPEPILMVVSVLGGLLVAVWRGKQEGSTKPLLVPIIAVTLGLGIGAAQLLPMHHFLPLTIRDAPFELTKSLVHTVPLSHAMSWTFGTDTTLLEPALVKSAFIHHLYMGFITLILAAHAVRRFGRSVWPLLALMIAVLFLGLGDAPPLFNLGHAILPGFDRIRIPPKFLSLVVLGLSYLVSRGWGDDQPIWKGAWIIGGILIGFQALSFLIAGGSPSLFFWSLSGVVVALVAFSIRKRAPAYLLVGIAIVGLDLGLHAHMPTVDPTIPATSPLGRALLSKAGPQDRLANISSDKPHSVITDLSERALNENRLRHLVFGTCRLLGVDWALDYWSLTSRNVYDAMKADGRSLASFPVNFVLHENSFSSSDIDLEPLARYREVTLSRRVNPPPVVQFSGPVTVNRTMNTVTIELGEHDGGDLVVRETWLPGWSAFADGQPIEVSEHNGWCRRVKVPKGTRQIMMSYHPPGAWGIWLTLVSVVALIGWLIKQNNHQSKKGPNQGTIKISDK